MRHEEEITTSEYEERRHAFKLCQWVDSKLKAMRVAGRFDELYFEGSKNIKKLREEVIPLSRLGLYLSTPESEVYVTCLAGNQNYDATIEITGFNPRSFKVEVTTTETEHSTRRRQALSRYGHVALSGPIWKDSDGIHWEGDMVDVGAEEEERTNLALDRLRAKIESEKYGEDTAILVYLTEYLPLSMYSRARLVRQTQRYLVDNAFQPYAVFYCYGVGYVIDHVQPGQI